MPQDLFGPSTENDAEFNKNYLQYQLPNAIQMRNGIDAIYWHSYGFFWAANAVLLIAILTSQTIPDNDAKTLSPLFIALYALIQTVIWQLIQSRLLTHIDVRESQIGKIETHLKIPNDVRLIVEREDNAFPEQLRNGPPTRRLVNWAFALVYIAWFAVFLFSFTQIIMTYLC